MRTMNRCLATILLAVLLSIGAVLPMVDTVRNDDGAVSSTENEGTARYSEGRNGNLVGHWKFNEGAGTSVTDETGNNNDGTLDQGTEGITEIGQAWVDGYASGALFVDGRDDVVTCGADPSLNIRNEITIIVWTKCNFDFDKAMVAKYSDADPGYMLKWDRGKGIMFTIDDTQQNVYTRFSNVNTVTNRWYHLAATFKDDTHLYIDGNPADGTASGTKPGSIGASAEPLTFGRKTGATSGYNGTFDEIKIYDRALSEQEIRDDFMKVTRRAGWALDETGGSSAGDSSEFGNDGSIGHDPSAGGDGTAPTWTEGILDNALEFDGTEDYMEAPDDASLDFAEDECLSLSAWVKTADPNGNILCKRFGDTFYRLRVVNGFLSGEISSDADGSANTAEAVSSGEDGKINDNSWHLVGMSLDYPDPPDPLRDPVLQLYIDGIEMAHADPTNVGDLTNSGSVNLGRDGYAQAGYLSGMVDQVEIWAWPLLARDFEHNYTTVSSIAPIPPSLVTNIPDKSFIEDTVANDIIKVTDFFSDMWDDPLDMSYSVVPVSDDGNIIAGLLNYTITFRTEEINWTGNETFKVVAENTKGLSSESNVFRITVTGENDLPVWTDIPPAIEMQEDIDFSSDFTLLDYVFDADGDDLEFLLYYPDDDLQINVTATGHINITPETKNYNGDILLNVSVREVGSQKQSLRKTIPVSVAPVNDPPVATLQSPASGTAQDGVNATLSWSYRDVDNALGDISFDLYFGKTESPPLLESGIKERKFNVTDLDDFTKYYWKVIPYDDENPGNCSSGVWNLTVDSLLNIPKVRLLAPASGVVIDELQVNISWEVMNNPTGKPLSYRIFLGPSPDNMSHKYNTKMTEYVLKDLQPSEDYYWSVEPYTSKGDGICLSEPNVWKITVGDVPVYKLLMETLITEITVPVGESRSINFTLINQGNRVLDVQVEIAGNISEHVTISDSMEVAIGETVFLDITIENPGTYPLGDYGIDITLTHEAGTNRKHVNVKYSKKPGNGGKEENGKDSFLVQYGLYIAGGVVLLLLFIILIVVIIVKVRKKKQDRIAAKKAKEEQEKRTREEEERKRFQAEQEALAKDHSRWRRDDVDYSKFEQVDTDGWEKDYMDEVKKEMKGAGQVRDLLAGAGTFSLEGDKPTGPVFGASMKVLDDDDAPSVQPQPTPAPAGAQAATRRPTPPPAAPVRPSKLPTATTRAVTGAPATTRPVTSPGGTAQPRQPTMTRPPGPPAATASPVTSPTASAAPPKVVLKPTEPAMEKDGKKAKGDTALDSVLKELELDKW